MPEHGRDGDNQEAIKRAIVQALQRRRDQRRPGELPRVVPAIVLARRFEIRPRGSRDSRKRGVRLLIKELREQDQVPILMERRGYYLATDLADYQRAEEFARRSGLADLALGATIKRNPERSDAAGQLGLFAGANPGRQ